MSDYKEIETTLQAGNGQAGNMFEIKAKKNLKVSGFFIHTELTKLVTCEVYTKLGSFTVSSNGWEHVQTEEVQGRGPGVPTALPMLTNPISVLAGQKQAFYITLSGGGGTDYVSYTNGRGVNRVFTQNDDVQFYEGVGVSNDFGARGSWSPRIWNGMITYALDPTVETNAPISTPGSAPTPETGVLETTMQAGTGQDGNMFEIVAKNDVSITGFSIHTAETVPVECEVYTRKGIYAVSSDGWDLVQRVTVTGQGLGVPTPLGRLPNPIAVSATDRQAFYITLTGDEYVQYTKADNWGLGVVFSENTDISFYTGVGVTYPFGSNNSWEKRVWNGEILYEIA